MMSMGPRWKKAEEKLLQFFFSDFAAEIFPQE
jgi:hypothetical protein